MQVTLHPPRSSQRALQWPVQFTAPVAKGVVGQVVLPAIFGTAQSAIALGIQVNPQFSDLAGQCS